LLPTAPRRALRLESGPLPGEVTMRSSWSWWASTLAMASTLLMIACDAQHAVGPDGQAPSLTKGSGGSLTVASITPDASPRDTTLDIHVFGSGYDRSAQASFLLNGLPDTLVRTNATKFVSQSEVVANVTVAADAVPDRYDAQVTLSTGKKGIGTELLTVQAILALNAGNDSEAWGVNGQEFVVGRYSSTGPCGTLTYQPFAWSQSLGLMPLSLPSGSCGGYALAINDANLIVGWVNGSIGVRWLPSGTGAWNVERLGTRPGGAPIGEAVDVDEQGQILTVDGVWTETTGLLPLAPAAGAASCLPRGMNAVGQITGTCTINGSNRAVLWPSKESVPVLLPNLNGAVGAEGRGINRSGVIAGIVTLRTKQHVNQYHAVRWVAGATSYSIEDLGTLGSDAQAYAVNEAGQIVGRSTVSGTNWNAFLWQPGIGMRNLGSLLPYGSAGLGISDSVASGSVVVVGYSTAGATRWVP
jgi:probable HAF family extracellular repeat protein